MNVQPYTQSLGFDLFSASRASRACLITLWLLISDELSVKRKENSRQLLRCTLMVPSWVINYGSRAVMTS